ncbi:MalY/PatB family protein [Cohnella soli]|uniref:cysteine-S-conjugate beta-lyase n=1 Tax=Cohnella soli TaxID=425005 RepID=A0ABW0HPX5_9BACL
MNYNFDDEEVHLARPDFLKWAVADKQFEGENLLPMWVADMDFPGPAPVIEALMKRVAMGLFTYASVPDSLYEAVGGWMENRHGWSIERNWVVWSQGVVSALAAAVRAFTAPGDHVIIQPPVYPPFAAVVQDQGRVVVSNPLKLVSDRYEMDFDDLEDKLRTTGARLLILCSPHNPVGRVWTQEELSRLAELCQAYDVLVIADEVHSDLILAGNKHIPFVLAAPDMAKQTITCVAPSKTFNMAGLQMAFTVVPDEDVRTKLSKEFGHIMPHPLSMAAVEAAYREGAEWLSQCLTYLDGNVEFAMSYLREHLPQAHVSRPEATYLLWVDCRAFGIAPDKLNAYLVQEAKVAVVDGAGFGEGEGFIRINLATRRSLVAEGLSRIVAALTK